VRAITHARTGANGRRAFCEPAFRLAGEIKALDPAPYGPVTITHSISITGVEGAGSFRTSAVDSITINAGPNDTVNLSHLTIDGQ
jgi:hypothetical protein